MSSDLILIGIDLGTSSIKVEAYDMNGKLVASERETISKQEPDEWLRALYKVIPRSIKESSVKKYVVIDSTSGSFLAVDKFGRPLTPPIMYYERDLESWEKIRRIHLNEIEEIKKRGGSIDSSSPLVKIYGLKTRRPELYTKVRWIIPVSSWLSYKLCYRENEEWTEVYTDYSNALKFGLDLTITPPNWYRGIYEALGLDLNLMPALAACGEYVCSARSELAQSIGLQGASVFHGMTDGTASALAGGALEVGDANIYTGSTTVPKLVTDKIVVDPALYYHIHPLQGYLAGSATGFTGYALSWFSEKLLGISVNEALEMASSIEPGDEFLFFPPGDRSPFYDPLLNPAIVDIRLTDESRERIIGKVIKGIMVGITLLEYYYLDLFEKIFQISIRNIGMNGGTTNSKTWNKLRASIFGKQIEIYGEKIAIGAIIPVIVKNKLFENISEIKRTFLRPLDIVVPDEKLAEHYKPLKSKFIDKWQKLREIYNL